MRDQAPNQSRYELVVLGIAQDGGLPHLGCQKPCCIEARQTGRILSPACLAIVDHVEGTSVLIEATPRVEAQLALLRSVTKTPEKPRRPTDAILITHAHIGHYTGLIHFGREVASTRGIPLHVSSRMERFLTENGPWSQLIELEQLSPKAFTPGVPFSPIDGITVTAIAVPHRDEFSDTVAFRIEGPTQTVTFCPDIDRLVDSAAESLFNGSHVVYFDATFYDGRELPDRKLSEIPHPPMVVTMERFAERGRTDPGSIRFIHLNHTNPALHDREIIEDLEGRGFLIAAEGERIPL